MFCVFITSIILFLPTLKQLHTKGPSLLVADIGIPASKAFRCKALKRSRLKRLATQSRSGNKSGGAIYRLNYNAIFQNNTMAQL